MTHSNKLLTLIFFGSHHSITVRSDPINILDEENFHCMILSSASFNATLRTPRLDIKNILIFNVLLHVCLC